MRKWLAIGCLGTLALSACAPQGAAPGGSGHTLASPDTTTPEAGIAPRQTVAPGEVVAIIKGQAITREQLSKPVFEAFGLRFLLHMAKLELARDQARELGVAVTEADVVRERDMTLDAWFKTHVPTDAISGTEAQKADFRKKEYEKLLVQYLERTHVSVPEFEIAVRTSAYIRKAVEVQIKGRITEQHLREAFGIEYGEKVKVRHIQCNNDVEMTEVRRRLGAGESFEDVARALSRDTASRQFGGEIRPFSRADRSFPSIFIQAAFALQKPDEVSDPIKTGDAVHIVKLVERISPQVVKFEDYRDSLERKLYDALLSVSMRDMHMRLANEVGSSIRIEDPVLRLQYKTQLDLASGNTSPTPEYVRRQIEMERQRATTQPAVPSLSPTTQRGRDEVARPPATMPGR